MASSRIKGITIEIGGDTTKLQDSLKEVDKSLSNTQKSLKDVNKLLKLDPNNVTLLKQKQELLNKAVDDTKDRLEILKKSLKDMKASPNADKTIEQQKALEREIAETSKTLKNYKKELSETHPYLNKLGSAADKAAKKTQKLSKAGAAVATGLVANAVAAGKTADDLLTLSKNTGISTTSLQKMQYASDLVDVSMDQMTGSMKKLTQKMSTGSDAFDTLGVSVTDVNGNMRDAEEVWYDCLEALSQVENETERDQLAMELFGKSAMDMSGIIDDGGASLKAYGEEAESMGLILSEDGVAAAGKFNDQIDILTGTVKSGFFEMGAALAESLTPMITSLVDGVKKVVKWFTSLDGNTQTVILTIAALVAAISPVLTIVSKITKGFGLLSNALTFFTSPAGIVVAALAGIVAAGVLVYKNWKTIREKAVLLWDKVKTVFGLIKDKINGVWDSVSTTASDVWTTITTTLSTAWDGIKTTASTVWTGIKDAVTGAWDSLKTSASTVFETIKKTITDKFDAVKKTISDVWETVKGKLESILDKVKGIFDKDNWKLPSIKLPHFRVVGKFGWTWDGGIELPKIAVDWYDKAMRSGAVFKNPTLIGAGEGGAEMLIGQNNLMNMIRKASSEGMTNNYGGVNITINVDDSITGKRLLDEIDQELANRMIRRKAVFG